DEGEAGLITTSSLLGIVEKKKNNYKSTCLERARVTQNQAWLMLVLNKPPLEFSVNPNSPFDINASGASDRRIGRPPNPVDSDGIPEIPHNEISADQVTMHRAYTEHLPHYGFVKPCSPQEEIDMSPNRLNPGFIADEIEFGRARTQPISLFEHRRWKVHHNLNKKDKFFRGHDERLHDGGGSATKYFRTKRHWYLYIRRLVTIYFVPLQLGVITGLLWANIDYDNYVYVWGTDDDESVDLGFSIAHHPVTLHFILNDIFMAFFFGIAMVEIVLALLPGGALSPVAKAIVPLLCSITALTAAIALNETPLP
ncbi:hypothetical protein FOZ63_002284, partial [Perkinsus olseni]